MCLPTWVPTAGHESGGVPRRRRRRTLAGRMTRPTPATTHPADRQTSCLLPTRAIWPAPSAFSGHHRKGFSARPAEQAGDLRLDLRQPAGKIPRPTSSVDFAGAPAGRAPHRRPRRAHQRAGNPPRRKGDPPIPAYTMWPVTVTGDEAGECS
ncbi:hypothetical protein Franean1_0579 [Parafrankia sp. EAN1pec]|nr:hypothetical protein Franean1_0579 [Frankia sp. EAN1pec]